MSQAIVFGSRLSPFVEKVVRALQLKRMPYRLEGLKTPFDLARWNPQTKKMPVLEIDGQRTYDSTWILRRLDTIQPEPPLFDADPAVAARQRLLEDWADESLYWYGMALRWTDANQARTAAQVLDDLPIPVLLRPLVGVLLPRQIKAMTVSQGMGRLPAEMIVEELAHRLDDLVELLREQPYLFAQRPSAADLAVFGQMHMLCSGPTPEAAELVEARPTLVAYRRRVDAATAPA